jgi:hypothetical protein
MNKIVHYLGLDVHKETMAVAIATSGKSSAAPRRLAVGWDYVRTTASAADVSSKLAPGKLTNRIANILRMAANALSRAPGRMGEYVRRFKGRLGKAEGIVAGAHKLRESSGR